jgi:3-phenylpropionate/trans-cinnamate dioxygenase ferredoxin subunit
MLVRVGDEVFALGDVCPHAGVGLHYGYVQNGCIECPAHMARFDLRTGVATYSSSVIVPTYPVTVQGDDVLLLSDPVAESASPECS